MREKSIRRPNQTMMLPIQNILNRFIAHSYTFLLSLAANILTAHRRLPLAETSPAGAAPMTLKISLASLWLNAKSPKSFPASRTFALAEPFAAWTTITAP
jgi:hypothetical protein